MGDILKTEAAYVRNFRTQLIPYAEITMLSGVIGEQYLYFYTDITKTERFGFGITGTFAGFLAKACCNVKGLLKKGLELFFFFDDDTSFKLELSIGGVTMGNDRHHFTPIEASTLQYLTIKNVTKVMCLHPKTGQEYTFILIPNHQYNTVNEGQRLLGIMVSRVGGVVSGKGMKDYPEEGQIKLRLT